MEQGINTLSAVSNHLRDVPFLLTSALVQEDSVVVPMYLDTRMKPIDFCFL
jgi:hypothetical protein